MSDITLKKINLSSPELPTLLRIYEEDFPIEERVYTVEQLISAREDAKLDVNALCEGEKTVGIVITISQETWAYLMFLGIDRQFQSGGYGAKALKAVLDMAGERPLIFVIEAIDPNASNAEQRVRRKKFYLRQGMHDTGFRRASGGCDFEFMSSREELSPEVLGALKGYFETIYPNLSK